ncbi:MAG: hypothetical protein JNM90_05810 [Burkholderiales bacterium]|nr:hypothetical protein [Burkholderiales bacterium]
MSADDSRSKVTILTDTYRIKGYIELLPGARLTDFLAESKAFFAVTDAEISDLSGRVSLREPFIDVARAHVQIMLPRH